jgi:hypothetical protein
MNINNRNIKKYKWCWVAKEVKDGWKLSLSVGSTDFKVNGAIFTSIEEIESIFGKSKVVFLQLKNTKYPIK